MTVRYSPRARNDLNDIFRYLDQRSPTGARNVMRAIYASVQFLAEQPLASQETDKRGIRVKVIQRYSFKIFYTVSNDAIEVIHIRHTARQPWNEVEE
jgi:plasmid stabilization system protein ParE